MGKATVHLTLSWLVVGAALAGSPEPPHDEAWVRQRVRQIQESDTTAWQQIPWAASLLEARRISAEQKQPVFLFTHDGNIETGRC
jgi:hypothetical protein